MKTMMAAVALAATVARADVYTWTGSGSDWTDSASWQKEGGGSGAPGAEDWIRFAPSAALAVDNNASGLTVYGIILDGSAATTIGGNAITLAGGGVSNVCSATGCAISAGLELSGSGQQIFFNNQPLNLSGTISGEGGIELRGVKGVELRGNNTFSGGVNRNSFLSYVDLYSDTGLGTGAFTACKGGESNSGNKGNTPLNLRGASAMTVANDLTFAHESYVSWNGAMVFYQNVTFTGKVTFNGQTRLTSNNQTYTVHFSNTVTSSSSILVLNTPCNIYFDSPVVVNQFYVDGSQQPKVHFTAAGNKVSSFYQTSTASPTYYFDVADALSGKAPYVECRSPNGTFDLCGHDTQWIRIFDSVPYGKQPSTTIKSDSAATLTLNATSDAVWGGRFNGAVSFDWAPTSAKTFTITGAVSSTTGKIKVSRGTVRIAKGATFQNISGIELAAGACLDCLQLGVLNPCATLELADDTAKLITLAGAVTSFAGVTINGQPLANGTYTAASCSWLEGGDVLVLPVPTQTVDVTWTGAQSKLFSNAGNWSAEPDFSSGETRATFAAQGCPNAEATVDVAAYLRGLVFNWDGAFTLSSSGIGALTLFDLGIDLSANRASARTSEISAPVELSVTQTWNLGSNNHLRVSGKLSTTAHGAFTLSKTGGGNLYLGENNDDFYGKIDIKHGYVIAEGNEPFGFSGLAGAEVSVLAIDGRSKGWSPWLKVKNVTTSKDIFLQCDGTSRQTLLIDSTSKTNTFNGYVCAYNVDKTQFPSGTVTVFAGGYGSGHGGTTYGNWGNNGLVIIKNKPMNVGTFEGSMGTIEFHVASNKVNGFHSWTSTASSPYGISGTTGYLKPSFFADWAFDLPNAHFYVGGNVWQLNGHPQRIGTLWTDPGMKVNSKDAPATLYVRQAETYCFTNFVSFTGYAGLSKYGSQDLRLNAVSTSTGTVEVTEGKLAFYELGKWQTATNVHVGTSATLEIRNGETFGKTTNVEIDEGGTFRLGLDGADSFTQTVQFLRVAGVKQSLGYYGSPACVDPRVAASRKLSCLAGPGVLFVRGDGLGTMLIFR